MSNLESSNMSDTNKKQKKYSKYHVYPPIYPNLEDWPIHKLSEDRAAFVKEIDAFTFERLNRKKSTDELSDLIAKTIYLERSRIKEEPWKVDPPNEKQFWGCLLYTSDAADE